MSDLIPSSDKQAYESVFDDIHDTFSREITIFKKSKKIFVATNNTYNALYSRVKNEKGTEKTVEAVKVKARIAYSGNFEYGRANSENEILGLDVPADFIRIKLNKDGYDLIKQASDIEVDGELFEITSDAAKAGIFTPQYYNILLKRRG
jgi:hypothetical protein